MAYKFDGDIKAIYRLFYSEKQRIQIQKESFKSAITHMDGLKWINDAPIKSSAELWKSSNGKLLVGNTFNDVLIRLENAYIKAKQYNAFAQSTLNEVRSVGMQMDIDYKKTKNIELTEKELEFDKNIGIKDCNELARYLTVWDMKDFIYKYQEKYLSDSSVLNELKNQNIQRQMDSQNFTKYVNALVKDYNALLVDNKNLCEKVCSEYNAMIGKLNSINAALGFVPQYPLNYYDGSREPIGCSSVAKSQTDYDDAINSWIVDYKRKKLGRIKPQKKDTKISNKANNTKKNKDLGR